MDLKLKNVFTDRSCMAALINMDMSPCRQIKTSLLLPIVIKYIYQTKLQIDFKKA